MNRPQLRIACRQMAPVVGRPRENQRAAADAIAAAVSAGARLVVLPELATSGYVFRSPEEVRSAALTRGSPVFEQWRALVSPADAVVIGGFPEAAPDGAFFNSAAVVGRQGLLAVYRKTHLWGDEKRWFRPGGDEPPVVTTPWGRVGVLVCYDLEFPELVRSLAIRGAEVVAVPTNWPLAPRPKGERPPEIINAMAAARLSRVFIACSDRVGTERGVEWTGGSCVVDCDGWVLAERAERDAGLIHADIDIGRARDKSLTDRNDVLGDRRPELYGVLLDEVVAPGAPGAPGSTRPDGSGAD